MSSSSIIVKIFRYTPKKDEKPKYRVYKVPFQMKGSRLIDILFFIREKYDGGLSFRASCKMGKCGACAVRLNNKPVLACEKIIEENEIVVEPLWSYRVIKDLVVDISNEQHQRLRSHSFIQRGSPSSGKPEKLFLKDFTGYEAATKCVECMSCNDVCHIYRVVPYEFSGPLTLVDLYRYVADPRDCEDRLKTLFFEGLYSCTRCGRCTEICPQKIDIEGYIVEELRKSTFLRDIIPVRLKESLNTLVSTGRAFSRPKASFIEKFFSSASDTEVKNEVTVFTGCMIDYSPRLQKIGEAALNLLRKLNIKTRLLKEEKCCGFPLFASGDISNGTKFAMDNIKLLSDIGAKEVVSLCAGCTFTIRRYYPKIFKSVKKKEFPFAVMTLAEYLTTNNKLVIFCDYNKQNLGIAVIYYDPCHLKYGLGIHDEPRRVISSIPGFRLVEIDNFDLCCGSMVHRYYYTRLAKRDDSQKVIEATAKVIASAGVKTVITECPMCILQISYGLERIGAQGIEVLHLAELLNKLLEK
jgi:fumarate reductase (CoM/CoB) subunit B